jgi:hypothetical protein
VVLNDPKGSRSNVAALAAHENIVVAAAVVTITKPYLFVGNSFHGGAEDEKRGRNGVGYRLGFLEVNRLAFAAAR